MINIVTSVESKAGNSSFDTDTVVMLPLEPGEELPDMENTKNEEESVLERFDEQTQIDSETVSRIGIIEKIRQQRSTQLQESTRKEFFHSKSLIDESIGQLQELTKLSIASIRSQKQESRDPQMVNAAINSAKAINELLKTKLSAAKMFKG